MKKLVIVFVILIVYFHLTPQVNANIQLSPENISAIQINRLSGGMRVFNENDGYEEPVLKKVVEWINSSNAIKEQTKKNIKTPIVELKIKMKNGDVAKIEPAYNCLVQNKINTCTMVDNEVTYTHNHQRVRLRSNELFDWLLAGWKFENTTPPKDSNELQINDILMVLLNPEIQKAVNNYYSAYLSEPTTVYPYQIEIINVVRIGVFRSFHFLITLETTPVVGAHNQVGKDRITFEIAPTIPSQIKLTKYKHLESYELPPHLKNLIKQKK